MKVFTREMADEALTQFEEVERLKLSLKRACSILDILEENVSLYKDEVVEISACHFERVRMHTSFLHPYLDVSSIDPF